jgi:mandelamide amidase
MPPVPPANPQSLIELDATDAVAAMRSGDLRSEDYARALLDRASRLATLNAFRTLEPDRVLEAARAADLRRAEGKALGRLHGLPIPVKDSVNTRDYPTSNGTRALENFRPREDAAVLKPLLAQGAIVMGKTNIHELSRSWTCNNGAFGPVRNPYDPERIPGGSSGGSAVAVAARMAPLAIAEDTLGSIRVPATFSGVIGLRPTFGRYPGEGIMPLTFDRFDTAGPLARSMRDIALFDDVLTGDTTPVAPKRLESVRLGLSDFLFGGLHPDVERIALASIAKLEAAGVTMVSAEIPEEARPAMDIARAIIGYENIHCISAFLRDQGIEMTFEELIAQASPNIRELYKITYGVEGRDQALRDREAMTEAFRRHYQVHRLDAMLFPAVLVPALPLGDNAEVEMPYGRVLLRNVIARNIALSPCARLASLVIPAGLTSSRLPVGMELAALPGQDRALLSLGLSVEEAWGRIPGP